MDVLYIFGVCWHSMRVPLGTKYARLVIDTYTAREREREKMGGDTHTQTHRTASQYSSVELKPMVQSHLQQPHTNHKFQPLLLACDIIKRRKAHTNWDSGDRKQNGKKRIEKERTATNNKNEEIPTLEERTENSASGAARIRGSSWWIIPSEKRIHSFGIWANWAYHWS